MMWNNPHRSQTRRCSSQPCLGGLLELATLDVGSLDQGLLQAQLELCRLFGEHEFCHAKNLSQEDPAVLIKMFHPQLSSATKRIRGSAKSSNIMIAPPHRKKKIFVCGLVLLYAESCAPVQLPVTANIQEDFPTTWGQRTHPSNNRTWDTCCMRARHLQDVLKSG